MSEVPLEVTHSGGIIIDDIENMEHNDESNEDEGKDEEVGLVAAVPVVQSERDSDSKSHEQQGKPAVAHKDRTRGDTSSEQGCYKAETVVDLSSNVIRGDYCCSCGTLCSPAS